MLVTIHQDTFIWVIFILAVIISCYLILAGVLGWKKPERYSIVDILIGIAVLVLLAASVV